MLWAILGVQVSLLEPVEKGVGMSIRLCFGEIVANSLNQDTRVGGEDYRIIGLQDYRSDPLRGVYHGILSSSSSSDLPGTNRGGNTDPDRHALPTPASHTDRHAPPTPGSKHATRGGFVPIGNSGRSL